MKIHITGASGAGSTTLGRELAGLLSYPYFDTDEYFWLPAEQPFTIRQEPELRNKQLTAALQSHENWVLGGSVMKWGDDFDTLFDLTVFLYIPATVRMERLKERELSRYGTSIFTDTARNKSYQEFLIWAEGYDLDKPGNGRSLKTHEHWLEALTSPVLEIRGDFTVQERLDLIFSKIEQSK